MYLVFLAISASCISTLRSRISSWYQSHRRLNRSSSMAASSSEITKTGKGKAIVVQTPIAPNTVGLHVPIKLTRDNFLLWKTQIFPLLNFHDLAHILTQDPPISTQLDDQGGIIVSSEYQAWWRQDQQVLSLIVTSLSESVLSCVIRKNTAKEAWSALSSYCSSTNPSRIMHLHNRLHNNSKGTRSVAEFVQEIQRTCDELAAAGHPVQETVSIYALLRGLGPSYSSFCAGISSNLSHLSLDDVIAQIHSYDELLKFSNPIKETSATDFAPMANQTQISSTDRGRGRNNGRNSRGRGRNGGRYVPRCQLCGQYGHRVLECRERFNRSFIGNQNAPQFQNSQSVPQAYNLNLLPASVSQDHSAWYPDSGATHHVTNDAQSLADPALYQGSDQLQIANGSGLTIYSTGSSSLISRSYPLKLSNILLVPETRKKLLSVYRLTNDNSVFVEFHADYCVVKDEETGRPLLQGTVKDGLYLLKQAHSPEANMGERTSLNNWHCRLGHPNLRLLHNVISTYGLPIFSGNKIDSCDACLSSKSHRLPYSKSPHQTSKPLEIIHSDLWGPSPVISYNGNRYYVCFIDDFTRYTWLYPLKLKSDVFQTFIDFQHRVERQFNQKIMSFQSDWGGEFQALSKYFKEHGIHHRISCPHTPAQNGTAERKHRHIIETALSLLHQSSVPAQYWDEAVCTAVYLINRLPTHLLGNNSPYHLVYNQDPQYSLLKNFGCTCYPCLRPYSSSKLDSRSERCIFLGYSACHSGYRCLSIASGKLYISRDVVFIEDAYPFKEKSQSISVRSLDNHPSIGLLGSSPIAIDPIHTSQSPQSPYQQLSTRNASIASELDDTSQSPQSSSHQQSTRNSSIASEQEHTSQSPQSSSHQSSNRNSSDLAITGHIPSTDPLSPSNMDSQNTQPHVKTRRLSDIIRTIDSGRNTQTTKFHLPTCLHVSSSFTPDPVNFASAVIKPEWKAAMEDEFSALMHNNTWQLVPRPHNRPVIGCK